MALAVAAGLFFVASVCQGATGFGFALVFVPLLSLVIDLKVAVAVSVIAGPITAIPTVWQLWREARGRVVIWILAGSLAGAPLGTALLVVTAPLTLRLIVAAVIALSTTAILLGATIPELRRPATAALAVGVCSGVLRGATSMGGLPVALYLLGLRVPPRAFVSTNASAYLAGSAFSIATLVAAGQVTPRVLTFAAVGVPVMLLGTALGTRLRGLASERVFRTAAIALLFASSVVVLLPALRGGG